ncbi:MFS transporter, partial [Salmonella enterica subsp. enterica]|nr:MFS transporter [Salmonella enterica subsp. enterica serovar Enteritidis]
FLGHFVSPVVSQPIIAHIGFAGLYGYAALALAVMACATLLAALWERKGRPQTI